MKTRALLVWLASLVAAMLAAPPGTAAAQSRAHLMLVVPPLPDDPADSAFALTLAEKLRRVVHNWERDVVSFRDMCAMLRASDYSCRKLVREDEATQLAAALGVDAYVTGRLTRDTNTVLELRLTSRTRAAYAGTIEVRGAGDLDADSTAGLTGAKLEDLWIAAGRARACYEARDAGRYEEAVRHAELAQARVPNHFAAAMCWTSVFELTNQSADSLIKGYSRALADDPRHDEVRHRLAGLYLQRGDTASATALLAENLRREPGNAPTRAAVAAGWIATGEPDSAFAVLRAGDDRAQENLEILRIIARGCLDKEMWQCQFTALAQQYELDSGLVGDTTFYYRIIGAAQKVGDERGVVHWTTEAVLHMQPTLDQAEEAVRAARRAARDARRVVRSLWMAHAEALGNGGARDSAVAVFFRLWREDTTDVRPLLGAARTLAGMQVLQLDSATAIDTTALRRSDSLLTAIAGRRDDDDVLQTVATIYFTSAAELVRARVAPAVATRWLENAMRYDVAGRLNERAQSLNGFALFLLTQQLDLQIRAGGTCVLVDQAEQTIVRARTATMAGQDAFPDLAQQVLQGLEAYAGFIPQFREVLQCRETR